MDGLQCGTFTCLVLLKIQSLIKILRYRHMYITCLQLNTQLRFTSYFCTPEWWRLFRIFDANVSVSSRRN